MEKNSRHDDEPEDSFSPPAMPIAPDGGIDGDLASAMIGQPQAVPLRTPENFKCLQDCRHYWHLVTMAQEGNPEDTWEHLGIKAPRQQHHTCLLNPGFETTFADDNAYECSKWNPMQHLELVQLQRNRDAYYDRHPEHRAIEIYETSEKADSAKGLGLVAWLRGAISKLLRRGRNQ